MQAHERLTESGIHALNIRLVLLIANHIGDLDALTALIEAAKESHACSAKRSYAFPWLHNCD